MADPNNRYGLTAARKHGGHGREIRTNSLTVDIHSHVHSARRGRVCRAACAT